LKLHEIGPNIKTLRKAAKLTQSDLADLAGISRVTYGRLERGEIATVSIKTIDIVLSALDYEIDIKAKEAYGIPVLE
jgi:transcriptional regulator with XRE-family HTH domain